ncbi:integrin beta-1-binding protein 2 isoform X2 [Struthio camelus]|uniref:integrin beta-1-binding protein 2 isoform X2 n=1 Tax=Struthio camelus TaxID=8801 RepID=UPI003603CF85
MASLCYNKGCGQRFDAEHNSPDSCVYHPGVPIFHDALKGWSCCKKRTTDFSEFLAIKGCTKGYHSKEKPPEPFSQEETADKPKAKPAAELIIQGPASAEKMQRERPSSDEPRQLLPIKVSRSLEQALERLSAGAEDEAREGNRAGEAAARVRAGAACANAACKAVYQGPGSNTETCTFHPGVPVFHEGMKYWSCCAVRTTDFGAFLEQPGCSTGRHCWAEKGDKTAVSCRQDWHQTSSHVVVTVYARNPLPALSTVKANRTVLEVHLVFEGNKIFQAELDLWGVIEVEKSFVSMVPTKVEITLSKASPVPWGRLELAQSRSRSGGEQAEKDVADTEEPAGAQGDDSDDSLSWSEEEDEEVEMGTPSH